jgi:hypothetical protein
MPELAEALSVRRPTDAGAAACPRREMAQQRIAVCKHNEQVVLFRICE